VAGPPLDPAVAREALKAHREHASQQKAAEALGISRSTLQSRLKTAAAMGITEKSYPSPQNTESVSVNGDACEITKTTARRVRTLADLIRVCEIDTAEWEVERWVCNKWDSAAKLGKDETERIAVTELYQIKAWLRRHSSAMLTMAALRDDLLADIRAEVAAARPAKAPTRKAINDGWLFEFSPFDLHMGKYTWDEETVTNYDSDIAADLFNASLDFLLARALKLTDGRLERILCVFGNDVAHVDSKRGDTTAGTRMDVDTRYIRVYRRICEIHRRAIDVLREVAPVDVKIVPGNHDELTSFHLGEILATRYDGVKHVTVDNSPRLRKYYEFGTNLFGFTHGDSEKVSELPLTMAREVPDLWARCPSREWHIGHLHKKEGWQAPGRVVQDLFSDKGVRVRRLASLSGHDAWHTKHAYMDRRTCEGFVFHRRAGFTADLSFNVDHFTGKATA
jgi:hypothetical protein